MIQYFSANPGLKRSTNLAVQINDGKVLEDIGSFYVVLLVQVETNLQAVCTILVCLSGSKYFLPILRLKCFTTFGLICFFQGFFVEKRVDFR